MNIEWTVTIYFMNEDADEIDCTEEVVYAPTQHAALEKAQAAATQHQNLIGADYWMIEIK